MKKKVIKKSVMSTEILSHFNCILCDGWWSIGDAFLGNRMEWFCPWCGVKNIYKENNSNNLIKKDNANNDIKNVDNNHKDKTKK